MDDIKATAMKVSQVHILTLPTMPLIFTPNQLATHCIIAPLAIIIITVVWTFMSRLLGIK